MTDQEARTPTLHLLALAAFCVATFLLIPRQAHLWGGAAWVVSALLVILARDRAFRFRMGILLAVIALLAVSPINTDRRTRHFITLGIPFSLVILAPTLLTRWRGERVIDWRFLPRRFSWRDIIYTALSVPLAWAVIEVYFFEINPDMPTHWPMPAEYDPESFWRLFVGINCVGIWDELFFINTVFALLRSLFPLRVANVGQAVVYMSVLNRMAFTGIGPVLIFLFALTQGFMYEKSRGLLYVLLVHVIVDAFLVMAIMQYHYPGRPLQWFL